MLQFVTFSRGIARIPHIESFLQAKVRLMTISNSASGADADAVCGWGNKTNTCRAQAYATQHQLPYYRLEDGFLRSFDLGVTGAPPLSLIIDKTGIYYDSHQPSDLEQLILKNQFSENEWHTAHIAISEVRQYQLCKYNRYNDRLPENISGSLNNVLVIDQTNGDVSIAGARATHETFVQMLAAARTENPNALIWIKVHPDVLAGKKNGHFSADNLPENVHLLSENINPYVLLSAMSKVYTVSSQMGFEALLAGKPVVTFGIPWYAGWGLSDDRHSDIPSLQAANRRLPRTLIQLFAAAYVQYCVYVNPNNGAVSDILATIAYLRKQKSDYALLNINLVGFGFSLWRRLLFREFLHSLCVPITFASSVRTLHHLADTQTPFTVLLWGMKYPNIAQWAQDRNIPLVRVEDGFLRSAGLGSNLTPPLSLSFDDQGIYFNPQQASRLETLLNETVFDEQILREAETLTQLMVEHHINKYNVGDEYETIAIPPGRRSILVPGQVEDDASIRFGSGAVKTNLGLLQAVRAHNPDAFVVYKPHPDVLSGNRIGQIPHEIVLEYADLQVAQTSISVCINAVDEVHTITSLAGFEGLIRNKKIVCYGTPFYAGWGLTEDLGNACFRRKRRLKLPELTAAALLLYPMYVHPQTRQSMSATDGLLWLKQAKQANIRIKSNWFSRKYVQLNYLAQLLLTRVYQVLKQY